MNKVFIKDFQAGDSLQTALLITNIVRGVTTNGAPYLSITLSDKTGSIEGKLWDVKEAQEKICVIGSIVDVNFDVINYRNVLQIKIHSIVPINEEYDISDFTRSSEVSIDSLKNEIYDTINNIKNPTLLKIVKTIIDENEKEFFLHPAASKNHHNYISGLAEHTCSMLKMAKATCDNYSYLDRDLLCSGVIIHDIGKLTELSSGLATEYTTEGKLLGHISIMQAYIFETCEKLGLEKTEECTLLRHMVLSHHGEYEFGSPVLPLIPEAEALSVIDNLDAKMNMLKKAMDEINPGEFTTKIFSLENRCFYKHH